LLSSDEVNHHSIAAADDVTEHWKETSEDWPAEVLTGRLKNSSSSLTVFNKVLRVRENPLCVAAILFNIYLKFTREVPARATYVHATDNISYSREPCCG
jgi:hypothetical protein